MSLWDYLLGLADPRHPRIQREGQDFVASNPGDPVGSKLRFVTQNLAKVTSPNTEAVLADRARGVHTELVWISPQPAAGEPNRTRPLAVAKISNERGRVTGEIRDLTKPDQPVIVEYPQDLDYDDLLALQGQGQRRPDSARVYVDDQTGERYATTQSVDDSRATSLRDRGAAIPTRRTQRRGF